MSMEVKKSNRKMAVIYIRARNDDPLLNNRLIAEQATTCIQALVRDNADIEEVVIDTQKSADDFTREGFKRLETLVNEKKVELIYCANLERISRNIERWGKFKNLCKTNDIEVRFANIKQDTSAESNLIESMFAVFNAYHSDLVASKRKLSKKLITNKK